MSSALVQRPPFQIVRPVGNTLNTQNRHVLDTRNEACRVELWLYADSHLCICAAQLRSCGGWASQIWWARPSTATPQPARSHDLPSCTTWAPRRSWLASSQVLHPRAESLQFHCREATCIVRTMSRLCLEGCKMSPSLQAVQAPAVPQGCTKTEWPHGGWLTTCHLWCLQASW